MLNEFRAIEKLCVKNSSEPLIRVYRFGKLVDSPYFYIDMELCDFSLEIYIYEIGISRASGLHSPRCFPSSRDTNSIWVTMRDISEGLAFIHRNSEVHRDLKPTNSDILFSTSLILVLYSVARGVWKIGDFGFSTERASTTRLTEVRRGTPSYRAPELLKDLPTFNDRVDIWALGCILYELVSQKKAFCDDWNVIEYARADAKRLVPLEPFIEVPSRIPLTNLIQTMLQVLPKGRPSARELSTLFNTVIVDGLATLCMQSEVIPFHSPVCSTSVDNNEVEPSKSIIFSVPYERNPFFVGRDVILKGLSDELSMKKPNRYNNRIALYGLGGIGKTQIALEYAHRHEEYYSYVFWISAVNSAELLSGFCQIAIVVRCALSLTVPEEVAKAVLRWLRATKDWLLIIDNLDDVKIVEGYLPDTNWGGHTLITTRNSNCDDIPATGMEIREMEQNDCVNLLLARILAVDPTEEVQNEARKIVNSLGGLPLAVEQAAAYIRSPENVTEYLKVFEEYRHAVLGWRLPANSTYKHTVATTWRMSLERLTVLCPKAAELLQYLAFMNPDEISVEFLKEGVEALPVSLQCLIKDPCHWRECVDALQNFCFIRIFKLSGTKIRIHRLVQAIIQDQLGHETKCRVLSHLIQLGLKSFPDSRLDMKRREICRRFRSQVVVFVKHCQSLRIANREWLGLVERLAVYLYVDGFFNDASVWWDLTFNIRKEIFGLEHSDTLRSMDGLVRSWGGLGRHKDACALATEALRLQRRVLGHEHSDTLRSMNTLATLYAYMHRFKEEAELLIKTFNIRRKILGEDHPDTLWSMNSLAACYANLGRTTEATRLSIDSLNIRKRVLGPDHPSTLQSMSKLV